MARAGTLSRVKTASAPRITWGQGLLHDSSSVLSVWEAIEACVRGSARLELGLGHGFNMMRWQCMVRGKSCREDVQAQVTGLRRLGRPPAVFNGK